MIAKNKMGRAQGQSTPQPIANQKYTAYDAPWLDHLQELVARHPDLGITADLAAMTLDELHGVYRFLKRIEEAKQ